MSVLVQFIKADSHPAHAGESTNDACLYVGYVNAWELKVRHMNTDDPYYVYDFTVTGTKEEIAAIAKFCEDLSSQEPREPFEDDDGNVIPVNLRCPRCNCRLSEYSTITSPTEYSFKCIWNHFEMPAKFRKNKHVHITQEELNEYLDGIEPCKTNIDPDDPNP